MINVVIPMAGAGSRFQAEGFDKPKPFIDVNGKMMIERVLDGVSLPDAHYTLIIQERFREENGAELERLSERYRTAFVTVEKLTQGACCTALAAFDIINNNLPVIFADSDNIFTREAFAGFAEDCLARRLDGSLLTFASDESCFRTRKRTRRAWWCGRARKKPSRATPSPGRICLRGGRILCAPPSI